MKKTVIINNTKQKKAKKSGKKFLKFVVFTALVVAALKVVEYLKNKKNEEKNQRRDIKEYYSIMGTKNITASGEDLTGIVVKSHMSAVNIDLTKANFNDEGFISVESCMCAVNIKVPRNINIKFDSLAKASVVNNETDAFDEVSEDATVYIALNTFCSAVHVHYAEEK